MKLLLTMFAFLGVMPINDQTLLTGAWQWKEGSEEKVWIFADGYCAQSSYDKINKKFMGTWGGPYKIDNDKLTIQTEFNTFDSTQIGKAVEYTLSGKGAKISLNSKGASQEWQRIDNGVGPLAGTWRISGRMQDGKMSEIKPGARKTLKILSATRFQWVAINPEVKGFYGTGGGTCMFFNGKYMEKIEFFSRDSSRVGATLSFEGKVANDLWTHTGLNSRGEPLHEEWTRVKH
ncbi:MAG TPA: hypothetical protein VD996_03370 [Chitinophagaceae bacterium]|nr:hypothetical protein [Chitinophagaceae bacterium]